MFNEINNSDALGAQQMRDGCGSLTGFERFSVLEPVDAQSGVAGGFEPRLEVSGAVLRHIGRVSDGLGEARRCLRVGQVGRHLRSQRSHR